MNKLSPIFGGEIKVKILRLFLFNPETPFLLGEIASRTQSLPRLVARELSALDKSGFLIKKRRIAKEDINSGKKITLRKTKGIGYTLDSRFPYIEALKNLFSISSIPANEALVRRFQGVGKLKAVIAAGVFVQDWDARVDLIIVGDAIDMPRLESVIKGIEAEVGKEMAYSAFETADFEYRLGIHDRLIRDVLDYPHITLVDRLGIESL